MTCLTWLVMLLGRAAYGVVWPGHPLGPRQRLLCIWSCSGALDWPLSMHRQSCMQRPGSLAPGLNKHIACGIRSMATCIPLAGLGAVPAGLLFPLLSAHAAADAASQVRPNSSHPRCHTCSCMDAALLAAEHAWAVQGQPCCLNMTRNPKAQPAAV